jgi:serine/threonine-protein phosphatase 6 regulatory ankyrin repeat subunit B
MKWHARNLLAAFLCVMALGGWVSCKKRSASIHADLGEAGYKFTTEDWFRASREANLAALKKFVAGGFAVDTRDGAGDSALHVAAQAGAEKSADYLLGRGLSVDLRGAMERTPLMTAVLANKTRMVRWLLRQGAAPRLKDKEGYTALMLAVREGAVGPLGELAIYTREDLDAALLVAALEGQPAVIDSLTKYGASVYARMEDGRTPLMLAAENGHAEAVALLLELGSGRFTTDPDGRTAADLATVGGHPEIADLILKKPLASELTLESPGEIATAMDAYVEAAAVDVAETGGEAVPGATEGAPGDGQDALGTPRGVPAALAGQTLGAPATTAAGPNDSGGVSRTTAAKAGVPIVMRHYREREMPVEVKSVQNDTATLRIAGATPREVKVRVGEMLPGSRLAIVKVQRRMSSGKANLGKLTEVSVLELKDTFTGARRELISGVPSSAHDPVALVEDANTGKRYTASPGQRFRDAAGAEYVVKDVRPNQVIVAEVASGAVHTLPLRGPRG